MPRPRLLLCLAALLTMAAAPKKAGRAQAGDLAAGALSALVGNYCEGSRDPNVATVEWPGPGYDYQARKPVWGPQKISQCYLATIALSEAVAAGALWSQSDAKEIEADPQATLRNPEKTHPAFKAEFGWALPDRAALKGSGFPTYNAKKLEALFKRFYLKPAATIGGVTGQAIYDVFFKTFVTRFAREAALVKEKVPKAEWAKLLAAYQAAAKEKADGFYGPEYLRQVAQSTFAEEGSDTRVLNGRTLGIMLRRRADGTWPTVVKLLKQVLRDYDPALAKELGPRL